MHVQLGCSIAPPRPLVHCTDAMRGWQEEIKAAERRAHAEQLRAQIAVREEIAKQARAAQMAEGAELRKHLVEHRALVEVLPAVDLLKALLS